MPDLTETQFLALALLILVAATLVALCVIATMFGAPQDEEDPIVPQKDPRWLIDNDTEYL